MVDLEYELPFELHLGLRYRLSHIDYRGTQHYRRTEQELNFDLARSFLKGKNLTVSLTGDTTSSTTTAASPTTSTKRQLNAFTTRPTAATS